MDAFVQLFSALLKSLIFLLWKKLLQRAIYQKPMKYFYQAALPRLFPSYKWIIILLQMGTPALLLNNCSKLTVQKLALNQHKKKSNERLCTGGHFRSFFNECRF